jgi:hypothetical protein
VTGYFAYHAVPTNSRSIVAFHYHVTDLWRLTLKRRGQKDRTTWADMARLVDHWLPKPHVLHPWLNQRFAVKYPRWERMRESRTYGSVRGALSNERPYRDPKYYSAMCFSASASSSTASVVVAQEHMNRTDPSMNR